VQIRLAEPDDLEAIVDIINAYIPMRTATAYLWPLTIDKAQHWFTSHDIRHPIWVADDGGEVVAWLSITAWSEREAYDATAELSVYVRAESLRRGVGSQLVAHAIDTAPSLGIDMLIAGAFSDNESSIALFERFAFERCAHFRGIATLDGVRRDVTFLQRALSAG
jgi:L-amino acid N-acyltransferase YncA